MLAQQVAAETGTYVSPEEGQRELLQHLWQKGALPVTGSRATCPGCSTSCGSQAIGPPNEHAGTQREALHQLRMARTLAVWHHKAFKDSRYKAGPFLPPPDPVEAGRELQEELDRLRQLVAGFETTVSVAKRTIDQEPQLRRHAETDSQALIYAKWIRTKEDRNPAVTAWPNKSHLDDFPPFSLSETSARLHLPGPPPSF